MMSSGRRLPAHGPWAHTYNPSPRHTRKTSTPITELRGLFSSNCPYSSQILPQLNHYWLAAFRNINRFCDCCQGHFLKNVPFSLLVFSSKSYTYFFAKPNYYTKTYGCTHGLVQMVHRGRGTWTPGNKWERHLHQNMNIFKTPTKSQCTLFWNQGVQHNTEFKHCFGAQSHFRDLTLHWAQKQNKTVEV